MDFERLRQIDQLFGHRWDVFVVGSLAAGPLRFGELAYQVSLHTRTKVPDSTITTIKDRLIRADLIHKVADDDGHHVYALTERGTHVADILAALTEALDECQKKRRAGLSPAVPD